MCKTRLGSDSRWFWNNFFLQNTLMARETPPIHGKIHLKFPLWLFEPLPDMFSRETSQHTIVFSCSSSQRLREQLHLIPITLNNYCSSRPLIIISHWKKTCFSKLIDVCFCRTIFFAFSFPGGAKQTIAIGSRAPPEQKNTVALNYWAPM